MMNFILRLKLIKIKSEFLFWLLKKEKNIPYVIRDITIIKKLKFRLRKSAYMNQNLIDYECLKLIKKPVKDKKKRKQRFVFIVKIYD